MTTQAEVRPSPTGNLGLGGVLEFEKPLVRIEREIAELEINQTQNRRDLSKDIRELRVRLESMTKRTYAKLTPWETVLVARHPRRPVLRDYIDGCVRDFCELHGDRCFGDDKAIVAGFGRIGGQKVMLIGHDKGRDTKEKIERHFGCAHPEGFRKALLKMRLAAKFKLPIVTVVDTQGAYPGDGAEARGIAQSIAVNLMEMSRLRVPICTLVIGEGGSGGALGIGVGDRLAMFEHAYYSVITPEGCAAILFKSAERASDAADALRLTSRELKKLNLVDDILPEPLGGGHRDKATMVAAFERYVVETLREIKRTRIDTLLKRRYERIRNLGNFFEHAADQKSSTKAKSSDAASARASRRNGNGQLGSGRLAAK